MMTHTSSLFRLIAAAICLGVALPAAPVGAQADEEPPPIEPQQVRAAVDAGLKWLAQQQIQSGEEAGGWSAGSYPVAVTSLAGLAFLAHGHLPTDPEYGHVVRAAMANVRQAQTSDGYLGARGRSMYIHAIATLFGLSYLGMAEDIQAEPELAQWVRRATNLTQQAQQVPKRSFEAGGWRYQPQAMDSDVSVTSWQLLSLHAARQCGYAIDPKAFPEGLRYVNSAWIEDEDGNVGFVYHPSVSVPEPEAGVTGAALGVLRLLNQPRDPRETQALKYLDGFPPVWRGTKQNKGYFFFVSFYKSLGYFQQGDAAWREFRPRIQRVLLDHQAGDGHWPFPDNSKDEVTRTGHAYSTAMALLILGIENQYLPMYQRQAELFITK